MQQARIPVFKPVIGEQEFAAARAALECGWLGMGSYVGAFEREVGRYVGADDRHVVAVSTGHAALHLALLLAGIGSGDEVVTPSFNNPADFQAILATGANPVFCDIDEETLCIDVDSAERALSRRTKAIIAMDYDCVLCDHDRLAALALRHGLRMVHDAAHSFGSRYKGRRVGSFSDMTMLSFDPVKTITCIDGGALVVRTQEEVERAHAMRLIGMTQPAKVMYQNARASTYDVVVPGFRYHMANLHAAIGLAQLAKADAIMESRRRACVSYSQRLAGLAEVTVPKSDFADIAPFLYYIRVPAAQREPLRKHLRERGIDTGVHWQPGHCFTLFKDCRRTDLAVTERVGREILSLPLHSFMLEETIEQVCAGVASYFRSNR
jgi:dTDP-4-amino-4,6-dideoxygalactose transaminase